MNNPEPVVFTNADQTQRVRFTYTNWKGETRQRQAIFCRFYLGSNEWHPDQQWLVVGYDVEKKAERTFALKDITGLEGVPGGYSDV